MDIFDWPITTKFKKNKMIKVRHSQNRLQRGEFSAKDMGSGMGLL
jgi:hypothetical protein